VELSFRGAQVFDFLLLRAEPFVFGLEFRIFIQIAL